MRQRAARVTDSHPAAPPTPLPGRRQQSNKRWPSRARRAIGLLVQGIAIGLIAVAVFFFVAPGVRTYVEPQTYVYGDAETAVYIAWSERDSQMSGVMHLATVDTSAQLIHSRTDGFTGLHDGAHVTITFTDLAATVPTIDGTLGWRSLHLALPQSNGQIASLPLAPGELADYNRAVQALLRAHPGFEIQGN